MPDAAALESMYGPNYLKVNSPVEDDGSSKNPGFVLDRLARADVPGVFIDYGCGSGELVAAARGMGWEAMGFEYDAEVARLISERTGCLVTHDVRRLMDDAGRPRADVLNIGDVIEHLTDLDHQFPRIVELLIPGGTLLAQGPLEVNPHLFVRILEFSKRLRPGRIATMPPYHTLLATSQGQKTFFDRHGLETVQYVVREVAWPAPVRFSRPALSRQNLFWALRRLSMAVSRLRSRHWGNRYLFEGRKPVSPVPASRSFT